MRKNTHWPIAFLVIAILVVALLCIAAFRLTQQEQALDRERHRERLDNAASLVTRESERVLAQTAAEESSSLTLRWDALGLRRTAGVPLLWVPEQAPDPDPPVNPFAAAEAIEFNNANPAQAISAYQALLNTPSLRPGALLRIARCQRSLGRSSQALATYAQLAALGPVRVAGAPAELVGLRERPGENERIRSILLAGKYPLDLPTFQFYANGLAIPEASLAWAEAASELHKRAADSTRGAAILTSRNTPFIAEWSRGSGRLVSFPAIQQRLARTLEGASIKWRLSENTAGLPGPTRTRKQAETGLPWAVTVGIPPEPAPSRVTLPIAALLLLGFAILGALYLAYRAVRRELHVAAMQSDFVSAVSHEFRTPITALTHLTDLLESGDTPEPRRPLYYKALSKETRRLHEMVENLLDFGRIEAGRYKYKPVAVNAADFVRDVLDEFRQQPIAAGRDIAFDAITATVAIDREAMRRAVWNLLDNAAKYSPAGTPLAAQVYQSAGWTAVSVQDHGPGIPREDRRRIFQKFVRGRSELGKGTGIGLAMVDAIVRAHGGRVELESEPGHGSRFTILLPPERKHA